MEQSVRDRQRQRRLTELLRKRMKIAASIVILICALKIPVIFSSHLHTEELLMLESKGSFSLIPTPCLFFGKSLKCICPFLSQTSFHKILLIKTIKPSHVEVVYHQYYLHFGKNHFSFASPQSGQKPMRSLVTITEQ